MYYYYFIYLPFCRFASFVGDIKRRELSRLRTKRVQNKMVYEKQKKKLTWCTEVKSFEFVWPDYTGRHISSRGLLKADDDDCGDK